MEKLGDFLASHRRGMLNRIYLAQQFGEAVQALVMGPVKVVVKGQTITLNCPEPAYAKRLTLERRKLEAILSRLAGPRHGLTLKIRVSG